MYVPQVSERPRDEGGPSAGPPALESALESTYRETGRLGKARAHPKGTLDGRHVMETDSRATYSSSQGCRR